ncbi:PilW family protein [Rheinheimera sp. WS51]|uniref:PilW family protein n=1 Tax=Rheinheimera sp. WS51 TaxID=3425886 RepID=UPI003D92A92F
MKKQKVISTFKMVGFSLTELMIAMVLGLLVLGGALGIFMSNQTTSRVNNSLSEVQNTARIAFQLMSKDIRSAGFSGCGNPVRVVNILNSAQPWATWNDGIRGLAAPVAAINGITPTLGTEAIRVMYASGVSSSINSHDTANAEFTLTAPSDLNPLDIAIVCDDTLTTLFQVSAVNAAANTLEYKTGAAPLNCTQNLGFLMPFNCATTPVRSFPSNAMVMRFESVAWFVAPSRDDSSVNSLYRAAVVGAQQINEEVLFGVSNIQFSYMDATTRQFRTANAVLNWGDIISVSVTLTIDDKVLKQLDLLESAKNINFIITLRNRVG